LKSLKDGAGLIGSTRSCRYANHKSEQKYDKSSDVVLPREKDAIKAQSAKIFYGNWQLVENNLEYLTVNDRHRHQYERSTESMKAMH